MFLLSEGGELFQLTSLRADITGFTEGGDGKQDADNQESTLPAQSQVQLLHQGASGSQSKAPCMVRLLEGPWNGAGVL